MRSTNRALASWLVSAAVFAAAVLFGVYELKGKLFTNELLARNEAERTLNLLLNVARSAREDRADSLRIPSLPNAGRPGPLGDVEDFADALESHPVLKERVLGIGAYGQDGRALFRYGTAPESMESFAEGTKMEGSPPRSYRFDRERGSLFIQHPIPVYRSRRDSPDDRRTARDGHTDYVLFYELKESELFARDATAAGIFAAWLVFAAAAVLLVRATVVKNAQYRQALRAQRELVALGTAARTLAHEIKNPLGAIRLQTNLVARLCPGVADRELAGIAEETDRIRLLVDRIGDFLREPKGSPERLDLALFAAKTLERAAPDGTPLAVRAAGGEIAVEADPLRLRSVIENIARNAYDSGGDPAGVEAEAREEGRCAVLEIGDRGKGLPPKAERERMFDPFYTTKTRGFGLGLALSRRFVEAAGGTLTLSEREGGGAVARVSLPKAKT